MAGEFDLSARITGDASGLVAATEQATGGYEAMERGQRDAASAARQLETATAGAASAVEQQAKGERDLAQAQDRTTRATEESTSETLAQVLARERSAKAAADTAAAEARLAGAQSAAERNTASAALAALKLQQAQDGVAASAQAQAAAVAAAEARVAQAHSDAERAAASAALAQLKLQQAQEAGSRTTTALDRDLAALRAELDPVGEAERRLASATDLANTALARGIITADQYEAHIARLRAGTANSSAEMNRQAFAARNLGQQFGDLGTQISLGSGFAQAFAAQAGQMGYALSDFGGRLGKVGAFLTGPWGIALTVGAVLAAPFIGKLLEGKSAAEEQADALDKAAGAADSYGAAQSSLGRVIDLTTGKLKTQNVVLIETIRLQARANLERARAAIAEADPDTPGRFAKFRDRLREAAKPGALLREGREESAQQRAVDASTRYLAKVAGQTALADRDPAAYAKQVNDAVLLTSANLDRIAVKGKVAGRSLSEVKLELLAIGKNGQDAAAAVESLGVLDGGPIPDSLKPYKRDRKKRVKKPKSTEARDEFGRDAADKIAGIVGQFDDAPKIIDQTNEKIRQLDDLIEDLGRKKPPNFAELIKQAEAAKVVVREGLIRQVALAFEQPKTLADKAGVAVKSLDAVIADLAAKKPPSFATLIESAKAAKAVILDGLQRPYNDFVKSQADQLEVQKLLTAGRVDEANALRTIQQLQASMGPLTQAQKDGVLATVQALREEQRALDLRNATNQKYLDALGSVKGLVQDATQAFVRGDLGQFIKTPGKLLDAFQTLQGQALFDRLFDGAFRELQDQINGTSTVKDASDRMAVAVDGVKASTDRTAAALDRLTQSAERAAAGVAGQPVPEGGPPAPPTVPGAEGEEVVVTGRRNPIAESIGKVGTSIAGLFTNPENAAKIGKSIGTFAGKGLEGAATGSIVAGVGKALGVKLNGTGAQVGGAIGSFLPIPGGQVIGSIAGGLIGNLFSKPKTGSASIGNVNGVAGVTGTSGNNADLQKAATGLAGSVTDTIDQIVAQLGGTLGNFAVSIGKSGDKFVVDESGRGSTKRGKKNDGVIAYDSAEEAQAAALANAIADGAVAGLSEAVQRAFRSTDNVDKAVREALGVKALEQALGGAAGALKGIFDAEDTAGRERLRLARTYGLDVIAVEKLNAEQRTKLVDDTLKTRLGGLNDFLNSLKFGDLAEGTPIERLAALQTEIDKVKADAEQGVEGAADKLAQLLAQKVSLARDSFGTAGGDYADTRADAISIVERIISSETQRVNAAAGITGDSATGKAIADATAATATQASETNDLLAQANSVLKEIARNLVPGAAYAGGGSVDYDLTRRNVSAV